MMADLVDIREKIKIFCIKKLKILFCNDFFI
jgi:hypothetical protein